MNTKGVVFTGLNGSRRCSVSFRHCMLQWANQVDMSTTLPVNVRLREILQGSCACTCVLRERHRERVYSLTGKETETQQDQPVYIIHMRKVESLPIVSGVGNVRI